MSIWGDIRRQADGHSIRKEESIQIDIETSGDPFIIIKDISAATAKLKTDNKKLLGDLNKLKRDIEKLSRYF